MQLQKDLIVAEPAPFVEDECAERAQNWYLEVSVPQIRAVQFRRGNWTEGEGVAREADRFGTFGVLVVRAVLRG